MDDREAAVWQVAEQLNWIQQRLDPDEDGDWSTYSERDKQFFYSCVVSLLADPAALRGALGE